jgi:hypothetical protein
MAVMGGDDIIADDKAHLRKPSQKIIGHRSRPTGSFGPQMARPGLKIDRPGREPAACGEMSQQNDHSDAQSTPQKFLRLVGFRDPNAGVSVKR